MLLGNNALYSFNSKGGSVTLDSKDNGAPINFIYSNANSAHCMMISLFGSECRR